MPFGRTRAIEPSLRVSTTDCSCTKDRKVLGFCNRHGGLEEKGAAPNRVRRLERTCREESVYSTATSSYCRIPSPISSAWATWDSQFVSGWTLSLIHISEPTR